MKTVLISIHKDPFEALADGRKKHEFRRRFYLKEKFRAVFYVTSPIKAICGIGLFGKPIKSSIDGLADIAKSHDFSSPEKVKDYFKGLDQGYALPLCDLKKIKPISLEQLRQDIDNFRPPQSYYYFDIKKIEKYLSGQHVDAINSTD